MTTELAQREMVYEVATGDQIRLTMNMVRKYLVSGRAEFVTDQEIMYFMHECKARRLNPFLRECWLIKYSSTDNAQIVESIHHKRNRARRHKDCQGWSKGIIYMLDGELVESTHPFMPPGAVLLGAYFEATPKGWSQPFRHEVSLASAVKRKKDGSFTSFWITEKQPQQLLKVVESQGLSALWGDEIGSSIIPEEVGEVDYTDVAAAPTPDELYGKTPIPTPSPEGDRSTSRLSEGQSFSGKTEMPPEPPEMQDRYDPTQEQVEVPPNWWEDEANWKHRKTVPALLLVMLGRGQGLQPFDLVQPDGSIISINEEYADLMHNLSKQNPGAVNSLDAASSAAKNGVMDKLKTVLGLDTNSADVLVNGRIDAFIGAHQPVPAEDAVQVDDEPDPMPEPWFVPALPGDFADQRLLVAQNIRDNFAPDIIRQAFEHFGYEQWPNLLADLANLLDKCRDLQEERF